MAALVAISQPGGMAADLIKGRQVIEGQDVGVLPRSLSKPRTLGDSGGALLAILAICANAVLVGGQVYVSYVFGFTIGITSCKYN